MRTFIITTLSLFILLSFAPSVFAAITPAAGNPTTPAAGNPVLKTGQNVTLINPLGSGTDLPTLLKKILEFVVYIGSIIVIFMMIYVGYKFVVARGNESKITEARQMLLWTVVGALVLLGAQAISLGIQATVQALSTGG